MAPETPFPLAAELAGIRERASQITGDHDPAECIADLGGPCSGHDAERLADVAEALLAPHVPVDRGRVTPCCEGCEKECCASPADCHEWIECPVRETITRELLGKEATDAG